MLRHHRRLVAVVATAIALAGTAPAALAVPVDSVGSAATNPAPLPVPVKVVRVDDGLDWGDAGLGAAGMLALVLVAAGGAHALTTTPRPQRS